MPELVRADLVRLEDDVWLDILAWSGPVDPGRIDGAARCTPMTAEMRGLIAAELRAGPRRVAPGLVLGPVTVHDVGGQRRGAALMRARKRLVESSFRGAETFAAFQDQGDGRARLHRGGGGVPPCRDRCEPRTSSATRWGCP